MSAYLKKQMKELVKTNLQLQSFKSSLYLFWSHLFALVSERTHGWRPRPHPPRAACQQRAARAELLPPGCWLRESDAAKQGWEKGQHGGSTRLPPGQPLSQKNVDQYTIRSTTNTSTYYPPRRGSAARFVYYSVGGWNVNATRWWATKQVSYQTVTAFHYREPS